MLPRTFCHLPGVGTTSERRLWAAGVRCWEDAAAANLPGQRGQRLRDGVRDSRACFDRGDARYFGQHLPSPEQWRLFANFRAKAAYLDIETTGLGLPDDHITTIALYDGQTVRHYVHGRNLAQFEFDAARYDLLVTFNGKSFDVPFIRRCLAVHLDQAHIDLLHVLHTLGYRGGLKAIERQLGLDRPDMADVDGYVAVLLWQEYRRTREPEVLETLLAYNVQDVLNLEPLMVLAFNRKIEATPFAEELRMVEPVGASNPFRAHREVVERVKRRMVGW
jgi:uncharacterized protein